MPEVDLSRLPQPLRIITEQPPAKPKSLGQRLRDIGLLGVLIGVISTAGAALVTAYFQHSRWSVEQRLARSASDFTAATTTFTTISTELARIQALQEIIFFLYLDAIAGPSPEKASYLAARAREVFPLYETGRVALRQKMDAFIYDTRRHLDWASFAGVPEVVALRGVNRDPLSYGVLKLAKFDCSNRLSVPQTVNQKRFEPSRMKDFLVDWGSSTHQLIVINYCLRQVHELMEPARIWAGNLLGLKDPSQALPAPARMPPETIKDIQETLDFGILRLNGYSSVGAAQVERIRALNAPSGFWSFVAAPAL